MEKLSAWLFLIIGLVWLLPLFQIDVSSWGPWIATLSLLIIGITEVMKATKK